VYVFLAEPGTNLPPRYGPSWFNPKPFFATDVTDWDTTQPLAFGPDGVVGFPGPLAELPAGHYRAQAVVRLNPDTARIGNGEGNAYGPAVDVTVDPAKGGSFPLVIDAIEHLSEPRPAEGVTYIEVPSPLLSAFHKRPIVMRAGMVLPPAARSADRDPALKWPSLYIIPGFGGDHRSAGNMARRSGGFGSDFVRILLDPDCGTGHHVFADSANNGPRGQALIEELIPYVEAHFPVIADPGARLVNGHSSGGWSSLWLQVAYPDAFGGVWSTSPDPVDFRDFQRIDLYAPGANMFHDPNGQRRPLARRGETPFIWYDDFSRMEDVIGPGGQLHSFEAVFSPRGDDGQPRPLWDRKTGDVDPVTAAAWKPYDIRLVLEERWPEIGPKLKGKLHVVTGSLDTFYLEGAVKLLKESLEKLGSDAEVRIVPGRDHSSIMDQALNDAMDAQMRQTIARFRPDLSEKKPATPPAEAAPKRAEPVGAATGAP
jgi:hypothetical protein